MAEKAKVRKARNGRDDYERSKIESEAAYEYRVYRRTSTKTLQWLAGPTADAEANRRSSRSG